MSKEKKNNQSKKNSNNNNNNNNNNDQLFRNIIKRGTAIDIEVPRFITFKSYMFTDFF